jgi:hypothetical protein
MTHLESRLREILPPKMSDDDVRVEFEKHLRAGEEMPAEHVKMFARLLSYNADLVDKEWADDQQSHWNISTEAKKETRVSFFVPCLRPRFEYVFDFLLLPLFFFARTGGSLTYENSVVEEIETGKEVIPHGQCGNCNKDAKTMCGSYVLNLGNAP